MINIVMVVSITFISDCSTVLIGKKIILNLENNMCKCSGCNICVHSVSNKFSCHLFSAIILGRKINWDYWQIYEKHWRVEILIVQLKILFCMASCSDCTSRLEAIYWNNKFENFRNVAIYSFQVYLLFV